MVAPSLPPNFCSALSTTCPGRISILRARQWARRRATPTGAGDPAGAFGCSIAWSWTITKRGELTEALFYHLQRRSLEQVLPGLIERALERGWRCAIEAGEERLRALDDLLWSYS